MNRGLVVIAGVSVVICLIAILLFAQEKSEKQALAQENNQLKNQVSNMEIAVKKILDAKPIQPKQVAGFGRELAVDIV